MRGLSQKDMAVYLGITNQQYQKYEAGNNRMGVWFLYKISQFLDVSFAKIVFPENPNNIIRMVSHIEIKEHIDFLSKYIRNMAHELLD